MPRQAFANKQCRETYVELAKILEQYGVKDYKLDWEGVHPSLLFGVQGRKIRFVFSKTTGDVRAIRNARSELAKKLRTAGLVPQEAVRTVPPLPAEPVSEPTPPPTVAEAPQVGEAPVQQPVSEETPPVEQVEPPNEPQEAQAADEPAPPVEPSAPTAEELEMDTDLVPFVRQQLLYMPVPQNPVLALELDRDLIAERGSRLIIDLTTERVRVISPQQFEIMYRPLPVKETRLAKAIATATRQSPPIDKVAATPPTAAPKSPHSIKGVGSQLGRIMVTMFYLQRSTGNSKVSSATLRDRLTERDRASVSGNLSYGQRRGFIVKIGPIPGSLGYYYELTAAGLKTAKELGDQPFEAAGLRPPTMPMAAE